MHDNCVVCLLHRCPGLAAPGLYMRVCVQHAVAKCECDVLQMLARATRIAELVAAESAHGTLLPAGDDSHQQLSNMYSLADKVSVLHARAGWRS